MIEAIAVTKAFNGNNVLGPVSVGCPRGKTTILLGQSGSGKSTLLRLFMGLIWPTQGHIKIDGVILSPASVQAIRRKIGYVTQDGGLFPHLTARQNILLAARYFKEEPAAEARLPHLLEITKLTADLMDRFPSELSGGQRQRISLIRALVLDAPVILLDEPMGALDPMIRADLQTDLKEAFTMLHKTVVIVTHDLAEAAYLGDQIVMMNDGKILQQGSFADLVKHPTAAYVTDFIAAQRPIPWPT
ncbi:MAG: ATP-binding cassette domain-containing protein [Deltaproteobacteria bacterium]|nr:ATP-binding cassette domain-containing protein [Deltaproteobacteria bacterium]